MFRTVFVFILILKTSLSDAQYPGYTKLINTGAFNKTLLASTKSTSSIQSDFVQEKNMSLLSDKIISKGKFWYKTGNNLRMEYQQPFTYLLIFNNDKILIRDGHSENKFSVNSNKTFQQVNRILIDCVSGNILENHDFTTTVYENNNTYLIELMPVPKNLKELYKNINIVIDKKDETANAIELFEISGDKTIIHFQHKIINAPISDSLFYIP